MLRSCSMLTGMLLALPVQASQPSRILSIHVSSFLVCARLLLLAVAHQHTWHGLITALDPAGRETVGYTQE